MKKFLIILTFFLLIVLIIFGFSQVIAPKSETTPAPLTPYVSDNGWLKVNGTNLKNNSNQNFTLKGISSHGIQWYSDILTPENLKNLKDTWGINTFRIAMYTNENGYISNKENIKQKVIDIANTVIDLDMYVIIDWHTLSDNNPNIYKQEAKDFFDEISKLYSNTPNIIYEICNEPNGNTVTWDTDIKPYAEEIIPIIRKNSPNSLIIIGTPSWCKDLAVAANNPLDFKNILYSCHFYAGSHKQELRDEVTKALDKGLPIIVSEFGTTDASGNGAVDTEETTKWIEFLKEKDISFINWSFCAKEESSAIIDKSFLENLDDSNYSNDFNDYLTESGKLIKSLFQEKEPSSH